MKTYTTNFSKLSVLIVDDAQVVISAVRAMLRAMGISDSCIDYAKESKSALCCIKSKKYDVIICDYNLGDGLNGRQLFEEIRHCKLLGPSAVFIMITGESSKAIVRSIIELRPDDYILKPFSQQQLQSRLKGALSKRIQYSALYELDYQNDARAGVELCNALLTKGHCNQLLVNQFKGHFLQSLCQYDEAEKLYRNLYKRHTDSWIKIELCNVLVELGGHDEVESIMATVNNGNTMSSIPELNIKSKLEIYKNNIPDAIAHLSLASHLAPGNPDRELVIANLCISEGDYVNAERHYKIYCSLCKGTYRDDLRSSFNVIRAMLFLIEKENYSVARNINIERIESFVISLYGITSSVDEKMSLEVIYIHCRILMSDLDKAIPLFYKVVKEIRNVDFYTYFHLCKICSLLMFDALYKLNFEVASNISFNRRDPLLSKSCMAMLHSLDMRHARQKKLYQESYNVSVSYRERQPKYELAILIKLHRINPYLLKVAFRIIELLGVIWPGTLSKLEVSELIGSCDNTISNIMSLSQQQHKNYQTILLVAKQYTVLKRA